MKGIEWLLLAAIFISNIAAADCIREAAEYHKVDACLVNAIVLVESGGNEKVISKPNKNGSQDIGLMQINELWLPTLKEFGISRQDLLDRCTNAYVGSWILAQNIAKYGTTWRAVGAYNAGPGKDKKEKNRKIYVDKVWSNFKALGCSQETKHPVEVAKKENTAGTLKKPTSETKKKLTAISEDVKI